MPDNDLMAPPTLEERRTVNGNTIAPLLQGPATFMSRMIETGTAGLSQPLRAAARSVDQPISFEEAQKQLAEEKAFGEKNYPKWSTAGEIAGYLTPGGVLKTGEQLITKGAAKAGAKAGILGAVGSGVAYEGIKGTIEGKKADEVAQQMLQSLAFDIAGAGLGKVAQPMGKAVLTKAGKVGAKMLANLNRIAPESIEFFVKNKEAVNKAIRDRLETFIPNYVTRFNNQLKTFVTDNLNKIDELARNDPTMVDPSPILKEAKNQVAKIGRLVSTNTKSRQLNSLKMTVERLEETLDGPISISDLNQVRKDLEEELATVLANTKIGRDTLGQAQESILGATLEVFNKHAPEIAAINKDLKKVIDAQKKLRIGSIFGPNDGLTEEKARQLLSTLYNEAKQQGGMLRAAQVLDDVAGVGLTNTARLFRAAQDLATQDLFSNSPTGRSLFGMLGGMNVGQMVGFPGAGAMLGGLVASPAMTKPLASTGYAAGKGLMSVISPVGGVAGSKVYQQMKEK